jgi:dihydroneopterin aldolase
MMDKIRLRRMVFDACHGVEPHEKNVPTKIEVDLEVETDLGEAGRTDDLNESVDYAQLYDEVAHVVTGPSRNLLESLAEEIAVRVLEIEGCSAATVTLRKINPPVGGACDCAEVEVRRVAGESVPRNRQ